MPDRPLDRRSFLGMLLAVPATVWAARRAADPEFAIGRVRYTGGDWYVGPRAIPELTAFVQANTLIRVAPDEEVVDLSRTQLYRFPMLFLTGHGDIQFTEAEVRALRRYLDQGGFLHIDDCYGLDDAARRAMRRVYPDQSFTELPFSHPIYHAHYRFADGLPKVHEHDGKPPQGFGLFNARGQLAVFYTYETDLHDGWQPQSVHNNPPDVRRAAKQMGTNILAYALTRPTEPSANAEAAQRITSEPRTATNS